MIHIAWKGQLWFCPVQKQYATESLFAGWHESMLMQHHVLAKKGFLNYITLIYHFLSLWSAKFSNGST